MKISNDVANFTEKRSSKEGFLTPKTCKQRRSTVFLFFLLVF